MNLDRKAILDRIGKFDFTGLFTQELGWDFPPAALTVAAGNQRFTLKAVAEKRGFVVYECPAAKIFPDYARRKLIERQVTRSTHEHLIIFTDADQSWQIWQWVRRSPGNPLVCREHSYTKGQSGEALFQSSRLFYAHGGTG